MMNGLDAVSSEYRPNAATAIENRLMLNWYPRRIIARFGHVPALLELGLGHGYAARSFSEACDRHVIIEGSPVVIQQFRQNMPDHRTEIVETCFEAFNTNDTFDVIVMGFILEHVDDPDLILHRYRQFLKPRGKLYVTVPNAKSLNRRLGLEMGLIEDIYSLNANDIALGHQRQYCLGRLRATIEHAGYHITHEEGIYLKPLPLSVLQTLDDLGANLQAMLQVGIEFPDLCAGILLEMEMP